VKNISSLRPPCAARPIGCACVTVKASTVAAGHHSWYNLPLCRLCADSVRARRHPAPSGGRGRQAATPPRLWGFPDPGLPRQRHMSCVCGRRAARRGISAPHGARHSEGDRQMGHERKLNDATRYYKLVQNARGAPTAHAHRRVANAARRWFFRRYYRRGMRVFKLRELGRRGAAARFTRRVAPAWSQNGQIRRSS